MQTKNSFKNPTENRRNRNDLDMWRIFFLIKSSICISFTNYVPKMFYFNARTQNKHCTIYACVNQAGQDGSEDAENAAGETNCGES